jgi:hypothetical protein
LAQPVHLHIKQERHMAFPPNYNQERNNRAKAKQRKALEKQQMRLDKSSQRKHEATEQEPLTPEPTPEKDA